MTLQKENITVVNIYEPNIGALKYIQQILTEIQGEINSNRRIVGEFNIPVTTVNKSSRQKINKKALALNETLDQMVLIDVYRIFNPKTEYILFSSSPGTCSRRGYILGHKTSLSTFKKIKMMSSIFSYHKDMKLEIN